MQMIKKILVFVSISFISLATLGLPKLVGAADCPASGSATLDVPSQVDYGQKLVFTASTQADLSGCLFYTIHLSVTDSASKVVVRDFDTGKGNNEPITLSIGAPAFAVDPNTASQQYSLKVDFVDNASNAFISEEKIFQVNYPAGGPKPPDGVTKPKPPGNTKDPNKSPGNTQNPPGKTPGPATAPCDFNATGGSTSDTLCNPLPQNNLGSIVIVLIGKFTAFIFTIAVGVLVFAGMRMVLSGGSEEQITVAKKTATWAIIGVVTAMLAYSIIAIIQNTLQSK